MNEYKVIKVKVPIMKDNRVISERLEETLNEYASNGWRVIKILDAFITSLPPYILVVFEKQ